MALNELVPTLPILNAANPMNSDDYKLLQDYDPASFDAQHAELHAQCGIFAYTIAAGRDPGDGNTVTMAWDVPFPLEVLSIFAAIGTVPATSVTVNVLSGATTMLVNGPISFLTAGGNNQKATVEVASGPGTVRLNAAVAKMANAAVLNVAFAQTGAGTTVDARAVITCRRRMS
jgi:hypothetical protein